MPDSRAANSIRPDAGAREQPRGGNRVDAPHSPARTAHDLARPPAAEPLPASALPEAIAEAWQQLERHSEELAEYLQQRQQALDRREAQLEARAQRLAAEEESATRRLERLAAEIDQRQQQLEQSSNRRPRGERSLAPAATSSVSTNEDLAAKWEQLAAEQRAWAAERDRQLRELHEAQREHRQRVARDTARLAKRDSVLQTMRKRLSVLARGLRQRLHALPNHTTWSSPARSHVTAFDPSQGANTNSPASPSPHEQPLQNLRQLAERLAAQRSALDRQAQQHREWTARRESQLEAQAAKLIARAHQLESKEKQAAGRAGTSDD